MISARFGASSILPRWNAISERVLARLARATPRPTPPRARPEVALHLRIPLRSVLLSILLATPTVAQPKAEVHERAFEETDSGLFLRGGGSAVSIEVEERCDPACDEDQECQIECSSDDCDSDAAPGASCNRCDWTCVP